jgi:CxxC motif-containing protein
MEAEYDEKGIISLKGNRCPKGRSFAESELYSPLRLVASTVAISGAAERRLPVKTSVPVRRADVFMVMAFIKSFKTSAPVEAGSVLAEQIPGTEAALVATRTMARITDA